MRKSKYYKMLERYASVSNNLDSLADDESFQKSKETLLLEINKLIRVCTCKLLNSDKRRQRNGCFSVIGIQQEPEAEIRDRLVDLRIKIKEGQKITKEDYEGTYVENGLLPFPFNMLFWTILIVAIIILSMMVGKGC